MHLNQVQFILQLVHDHYYHYCVHCSHCKTIDFINSMDFTDTCYQMIQHLQRSYGAVENEDVLSEYHLCISFADELVVDAGGVCCDLFSAF